MFIGEFLHSLACNPPNMDLRSIEKKSFCSPILSRLLNPFFSNMFSLSNIQPLTKHTLPRPTPSTCFQHRLINLPTISLSAQRHIEVNQHVQQNTVLAMALLVEEVDVFGSLVSFCLVFIFLFADGSDTSLFLQIFDSFHSLGWLSKGKKG